VSVRERQAFSAALAVFTVIDVSQCDVEAPMDCVLRCRIEPWYCPSPLTAVLLDDGWAPAARLEGSASYTVLEVHPDQNAERNAADNNGEQLSLTRTGLLRRLWLAKLDDVIAHDACLLVFVAIEYASRVPFKRGFRFFCW